MSERIAKVLQELEELRDQVLIHRHSSGMHEVMQRLDLDRAEQEIARLNALVSEAERSAFKTSLKGRPECDCGCGAKA